MRHAKAARGRPFREAPYVLRMKPITEQTILVTVATDGLGRGIALHVA
jgi:hypothetical protein